MLSMEPFLDTCAESPAGLQQITKVLQQGTDSAKPQLDN